MSHVYTVRPRDGGASIRIEEAGPEAAAAAYLEDWIPGEEDETAVIVRELDTGQEHCFRVDVHTGQTQPCG